MLSTAVPGPGVGRSDHHSEQPTEKDWGEASAAGLKPTLVRYWTARSSWASSCSDEMILADISGGCCVAAF